MCVQRSVERIGLAIVGFGDDPGLLAPQLACPTCYVVDQSSGSALALMQGRYPKVVDVELGGSVYVVLDHRLDLPHNDATDCRYDQQLAILEHGLKEFPVDVVVEDVISNDVENAGIASVDSDEFGPAFVFHGRKVLDPQQ